MLILFSGILKGLAFVVASITQLFIILVVVRALISWVNPDPYNGVVRFLTAATDPLLAPVQRFVPRFGPGIDLSPLVLLMALYFIQESVPYVLLMYAGQLAAAAVSAPAAIPNPQMF